MTTSRLRSMVLSALVLAILGSVFLAVRKRDSIKQLEAAGVEMNDWEGMFVRLEELLEGGDHPDGTRPFTAVLPFSRSNEVIIPADSADHFGSAKELGKALRLSGDARAIHVFLRSGYSDFLEGLGYLSDLRYFYLGLGDKFSATDLETLSRFRSLDSIDLCSGTLVDVPDLRFPKLTDFRLQNGAADLSLIRVLNACENLTYIRVHGVGLDDESALQMIDGHPSIKHAYVSRIEPYEQWWLQEFNENE